MCDNDHYHKGRETDYYHRSEDGSKKREPPRHYDKDDGYDSQVPKRVVSKRVVLADVPPYRHFVFVNFLVFYVLQFGAVSLPEGGDQTKCSP